MNNPTPAPQNSSLSHPGVSVAKGFALMLETACEHFEILQRLIRGETAVVSTTGRNDFRAQPCVQMALAKSFVFYVVRARRICERGAGSLTVDRSARKVFLNGTAGALGVRDVNEHGFDADASSKPSMHTHPDESGILDETAMEVVGDKKILMGSLNLYDIYVPAAQMRKLAGFASLQNRQSI